MLFVAALPLGAEQRDRNANTGSNSVAAPTANAAEARPAVGPVDSYQKFMRMIKMNGQFDQAMSSGQGMNFSRPAGVTPDAPSGVPRKGQNVKVHNDPNGPCPRAQLLCTIYSTVADFEADHGTFDRVSGTFEDFELTNGPAGSGCFVDDGTKTPDADCRQSPDTFGIFGCAIAIDAGDILTGVAMDNNGAQRGNTWWEILALGNGFNGSTSRYLIVNYFADTTDIFFNLQAPACDDAKSPTAVGFNIITPFGDASSTVTVNLSDGQSFAFDPGSVPTGAGLFVGLCCQGIGIDLVNLNQGGGEPTFGADNIRYKVSTGACPIQYAALTLEDIGCALDVIEAKLDAGGGGGGSIR